MQILSSNGGAAGVPFVEVAELDSEEGGLEFVEAGVDSPRFVMIFLS